VRIFVAVEYVDDSKLANCQDQAVCCLRSSELTRARFDFLTFSAQIDRLANEGARQSRMDRTYNHLSVTQLANDATESPFLRRLGFVAGAGVEVPIAPHWTARLEYLFTDYGNSSTTFFAGAQRIDSNFALQELRAGLNY
jgi:opacity protein-like surface antigen